MKFQMDRAFDLLDAISFMKKHLFILYAHTCHGILVEARGICEEASSPSFPSRGFGDPTQVIRLGGKCLCLLSRFVECHFFITDMLIH